MHRHAAIFVGLLGGLAANWAAGEATTQPATRPAPQTPADKPFDEKAIALVERLQRNRWAGWPDGTAFTRRFVDDHRPGVRSHVSPDLNYRILEKDQLLIRKQLVRGRETQQEISTKHDLGMPEPSVIDPGVRAGLTLDDARVECMQYESSINNVLSLRQWVLADRPSILVRSEHRGNWWAIVSLKETRRIGPRVYRCIKTQERMKIVGGYVVLTKYLSPDVPGFLVEGNTEFFDKGTEDKPDASPWMVEHEQTVDIVLPDAATKPRD